MEFLLGYVGGIATATLVAALLVLFKHPVERSIKTVETTISSIGPRPKGYIFQPEDEATEMRNEIITKNKKRGLDTPIKDLR